MVNLFSTVLLGSAGLASGWIYKDSSPVQMQAPKFQREKLRDEELANVFSERKKNLQNFCKNKQPDAVKKTWQDRPTHVYVADVDLGLMGCIPLKSGSSTWKTWWWYYKTPNTDHDGRRTPGGKMEINEISHADGQAFLEDKSKLRFLVVRHPLLRVYSGWNQKLLKTDPTSKQILNKAPYLQKLANINNADPSNLHSVDFSDFLHLNVNETLFKENVRGPNINPHFEPISTSCDICSFDYDYIIKLETMNDEANYVLRQTGLDIKPEDGFMHRNSQLIDDEKLGYDIMKEKMTNLNKTDLEGLYKKYNDDFEAFGYNMDIDNGMLSGW